MSKELVISANRHETKVAILEDDQLVEVYFQRANEYSLAGSIHKGRVTRVLPGMQSAFVDLGLERDTFLYVSDFLEEGGDDVDRVLPVREERPAKHERLPRAEKPEPIAGPPEPLLLESVPEAEEPEGLAEGGEAVALGLADAPPAAVAAPERREGAGRDAGRRDEADDRGRGRRGRRRRNRGRGFPDSKYSSEAAPAPAPRADTPEAIPTPALQASAAEQEDDFEFPVLPGESLAKYRQPASANGSEDREESEPEARATEHYEPVTPEPVASVQPPAPDEIPLHESYFSAGSGAALARQPEVEPEPEPEMATVTEHFIAPSPASSDSPMYEEPVPEAEAISDIIAMERESAAFSAEDLAESPVPTVELLEPESLEEEVDLVEAEPGEELAPQSGARQHNQGRDREPGGRYGRGSRRLRRRPRGAPGAAPSAETPTPRPESAPRSEPRSGFRAGEKPSGIPSISDLLKEGQEIIVQIAKEPLGQKGARITSHIALPGRYVVFMPTLEHMGVSRKIASDEERLRLKKILQAHRSTVQGGYIVRTAGEGKTEEEILADMSFLANLWTDIRQKAEKRPAPVLLHHDLDIVQRILRDQVTDQFKSIWVDNEEAYESILSFVQRFQPALVTRVKLYTRPAPIFDTFNITPDLEKALRPKVWLKSGGYIVINQTEALVAIDVNTGKYVGKSNRLEDTIVKTNTEAVKEIVRQIRLRDLGGIIVVDFIDMDERKNRQKVMQALEESMRSDKAPNKILQFNDFGLVAITRKRVKQSLERALCAPCPYCEGAGYVKSVQTTVGDIVQEAHKMARAVEGKDVLLRVHPEVAKFLKSSQNKYLEELEEVLRRPVMVKSDPALHQDKFDLA